MSRTSRGKDLPPPIEREVEHAVGICTDRVVDPWRRDTVTILQHRIECYPVMLLWQVLRADADRHAVTDKAAKCIVMPLAPRHQADRLGVDRLGADTDRAIELEVETAHKAARTVGLVKLLAPQTERWASMSVHRLVDIADNV